MAYNHPQGACQPVPPNPFQQLAEEFRRLAAEAVSDKTYWHIPDFRSLLIGKREAFEQAAQMLEEKLNG